ncbi:hypothetical protein FFLO_04538 [Filobasidium floriforme]|uniref:Protein kinase domain-containing protein n=1 Tax=Filobasidium floriforme TaxID=5210 RepID=A0A8K0JIP3_9TREE|nr:hypothetical protein FFLO_04538 [Filobasidium floriforme]
MDDYKIVRQKVSENFDGWPEEDLGTPENGCHKDRSCVSQFRPCRLYLELDCSSVRREERFVAIKIMTGFASKNYQAGKADEIGILKKSLSAAESQEKYAAHIVRYYDNFTYTGPTSVVHNIIVTEPLAHSLQELQNTLPKRAIPLWLCKYFAKQVLQAISYLHEACGVVYGDLKSDNILFRPEDVDAVINQELINDPSCSYDRPEGKPVYGGTIAFRSQPLPPWTGKGSKEAIGKMTAVLADFGHSHWSHKHFQEIIQPFSLRAPEVHMGYGWTTSADIWSFGCLMFEWATGVWLFEPDLLPSCSEEEAHLVQMTEALGEKIPMVMIEKSKHKDKYFGADGSFAHPKAEGGFAYPTVKESLKLIAPQMSSEDKTSLERFIRKCLVFQPEDRPTASDLLNDAWFNDA